VRRKLAIVCVTPGLSSATRTRSRQSCEATNRNVQRGRIGQASEHNITKPSPDDRSGKPRACAAKHHVFIRGDLHSLAKAKKDSLGSGLVFGVHAEQMPVLNATCVENAAPINVLTAVEHLSGLYANTGYLKAFHIAAVHVSELPRSQESFSKHSVTEYTEKPSRAASLCSQCLSVSTSGFAGGRSCVWCLGVSVEHRPGQPISHQSTDGDGARDKDRFSGKATAFTDAFMPYALSLTKPSEQTMPRSLQRILEGCGSSAFLVVF
jgi:hypothetical protein